MKYCKRRLKECKKNLFHHFLSFFLLQLFPKWWTTRFSIFSTEHFDVILFWGNGASEIYSWRRRTKNVVSTESLWKRRSKKKNENCDAAPLVDSIDNAINANRSEFMRDNAFRCLVKCFRQQHTETELPSLVLVFVIAIWSEAENSIYFTDFKCGIVRSHCTLDSSRCLVDGIYYVDFSVFYFGCAECMCVCVRRVSTLEKWL